MSSWWERLEPGEQVGVILVGAVVGMLALIGVVMLLHVATGGAL